MVSSDEDEEPRVKSRRGAVMIFLFGWLFLPVLAVLLDELSSPWFEIACVAMVAFVAAFGWAMVRVVRDW